jgi:hypothetical protein
MQKNTGLQALEDPTGVLIGPTFKPTTSLVHIEETFAATSPPVDLAQYKIHTVDSTIEERSEEQECTQSIEEKNSSQERKQEQKSKSDISGSMRVSSSVDVSGNIERNQYKLRQIAHSRISSQGAGQQNVSISSGLSGSSMTDRSLLDMRAQQQQLIRMNLQVRDTLAYLNR